MGNKGKINLGYYSTVQSTPTNNIKYSLNRNYYYYSKVKSQIVQGLQRWPIYRQLQNVKMGTWFSLLLKKEQLIFANFLR